MGQDLSTDEESIKYATLNSLRRAQELGLESIAFPALGAGVDGFPLSRVASMMRGEVERHLKGPGVKLRRLVFALFGAVACMAFESELARREAPI